MTIITLRTDKSEKDRYVVAETRPSANDAPDHRKGNVDTPAGTQIKWKAEPGGPVSLYTVTFSNLSDDTKTWPFVELEDGTGIAPSGYVGPLTLAPNGSVSLTTKADADGSFKYDVTATPNSNKTILDLDPMIIIRPGLRSIIAAGLPWAVAGAALGALITWYILNR